MTALHIFATLPLHLVLLLARFAGWLERDTEPEPEPDVVFFVAGLTLEPLPGLGAWTRGCYGDF